MKKLLSLLLTLAMLLSVAAVTVNAYDGELEEGVLINAMLTSDDIPYSEDFSAEKTGEYAIIAMSPASLSGKITLNGETVISFESTFEDDMYMVEEYVELSEGNTYTLSIDSFKGGNDDFIVVAVAEASLLETSEVLQEFVSTDEIPYSMDFVTSSAEQYTVQIYSPVNVSGKILDENGSTVYEYNTYNGDELYILSDMITLSPESTYTFTIDKCDGASEDTVDIYIAEAGSDEGDLYFDVLKYSDLPLDAVMIPNTTGKYDVTIGSPVDFTASIVNSSGETVAEFKPEYDETEYSVYETVILSEGEEYHLLLNASEEFDGRIFINVSEKYVDPDAILEEDIKGSDVPASFKFSSETDDFYTVSLMADAILDWRIVDQNGNEIISKKYDPNTVGMYSAIIKAEAGAEYTLYVDNYKGSGDDDIFLSITKIVKENEEEFPVSKLITADSIPYSVDFTAPEKGIYYSEISAPAEFSASIKDKDGNVVMTLDSKLDVTTDYLASNYAYLNAGETYTISIDSYSGKPTDVISIDADYLDINFDVDNCILNETFLYNDLDNGPKTFEMTAEETCDYSLGIVSVSPIKYKVTDEDGNVLMQAETESLEIEMASDYAAFEAGKKYYLTLEGYPDNENGPVMAIVLKSEEFDFDVTEINYYDDGEKLTDIADIMIAYHGTDTDVFVPLDMSEVGAIGQYAFENKNIESVTLDEGYEVIYNYAFLNCKDLTEVYLPETLSVINYGAFMGCDNLKSIVIGSDIFRIEPYALGYDSNMNKIEDFVICGYSGTAAEQYAIDNGFTFIDVENVPTENPTEIEPTTEKITTVKNTDNTTTVNKVKSPNTTTKTTNTVPVNNSEDSNANTGTKSYVLVIFIIVLAAIAVVIVIKVVKIKKQK